MGKLKHNSGRAGMVLPVFLLIGPRLWAQAETAGQAEVAFQGYYLAGSGQPLLQTSGMAVSLKEFIPRLGLLDSNAEGYGSNGFRSGTSFIGLEQVPLWGWHWDFVGGDFRLAANLVENPFLNVYTPEISGRGVRVAMKRKGRTYQFFMGEETLLGGPRIPFRVTLPQMVLGGTAQQKVGEHWQFGVRYIHTSTDASAFSRYANYFLSGRDYRTSDSATFQSTYSFTPHLRFYAEAGYGTASTFSSSAVGEGLAVSQQQPFSLLVGPSWETDKFSLRANYVRQSTTYLPLLGYFVGDRQGPYVEGHYRPVKWADVYGSASAYSNNLENNSEMPTFHSSGFTTGASFILPWKFNASASLSSLQYTERDPARPGLFPSDNRQINLSLSRPVKRHNLRFSLIDMKLNTNFRPQTQRFEEVEDTFTWKHFVLGGAVRLQNSSATESRNTVFFRGSLQANIKRISAYGYMEKGSDLVNKSVFSTNAYSSTVAGVSTPLIKGWNLHFEAFRNNLNTALNAENIFLFPSSGLGLNTALSEFNQWSVYFRVSKQVHWGKLVAGAAGGIEQYAAAHAPLVGSIQGLVVEHSLAGPRPAPNVAVSLDHYRDAVTDATGRYAFSDVPEGPHEVGLDMEQLPTDYEPGPEANARVGVEPRALVRTDFSVLRLTKLTGRILAPTNAPVENLVVRLAGTKLYTTPDPDGSFAFYNLREGEYDLVIDSQSVPEGYVLASPANVHAAATNANPAAPIGFELRIKPEPEKPVRQMLQEEIHLGRAGSRG